MSKVTDCSFREVFLPLCFTQVFVLMPQAIPELVSREPSVLAYHRRQPSALAYHRREPAVLAYHRRESAVLAYHHSRLANLLGWDLN
jgi:hypothetical protein